ncbi:hypothetical protein L227DRAFT_575032 [Lentinus tigrinus ALCF2SS1-6]|uniref:Uncharacterized protein n=1 Tax=Lentinus tigrinus ALCF2SS1-6 TaxID=1328759 RepID=A0A5C2SHM9_9APHY|nr:hypothetical protein L227DRAFT_575032 [Lentinus tigrinus ALCF2SS1-6]
MTLMPVSQEVILTVMLLLYSPAPGPLSYCFSIVGGHTLFSTQHFEQATSAHPKLKDSSRPGCRSSGRRAARSSWDFAG